MCICVCGVCVHTYTYMRVCVFVCVCVRVHIYKDMYILQISVRISSCSSHLANICAHQLLLVSDPRVPSASPTMTCSSSPPPPLAPFRPPLFFAPPRTTFDPLCSSLSRLPSPPKHRPKHLQARIMHERASPCPRCQAGGGCNSSSTIVRVILCILW